MTKRPVYLDYQATTPIDPVVRERMMPYLGEVFGNPHSIDHCYGLDAAKAIRLARAQVAYLLNADDTEIVFTSGATESCNLALRGVANRPGNGIRNRIITVATEHPAVIETVRELGQSDFDAVILPVGSNGILDLDILKQALDERTLIVSVMAVNNEIGVVQPISEIGSLCRAAGTLFHCDATQAASRLAIDVNNWNVDLLSISSHKMYGPKGVGALYVRSGVQLKPIITGGSQEAGIRGGTLSPALIAGFGAACEIAAMRLETDMERMLTLTSRLHTGLRKSLPTIQLFGSLERRVAGNLNIGLTGIPADEVIANLSEDIAVSSGSACASAAIEPSPVLLALGLDPETAGTGIRISLGRFSTESDIDAAISAFSRFSTISCIA